MLCFDRLQFHFVAIDGNCSQIRIWLALQTYNFIFHVYCLLSLVALRNSTAIFWFMKQSILSGSVSEKFPGQTGSLEFFTALLDKIFCLGLSSHSWASGKFVYARYARYTNSNALLWLRLSSIDVFCPHFVQAKNRHLPSCVYQALHKLILFRGLKNTRGWMAGCFPERSERKKH